MPFKALIACESSGRVRDAFAARGWDAWSCDLEASEMPGQHIQGDINSFYDMVHAMPFHLIVAFPPCTDLSLAGARFWQEKRADGRQQAAAIFFMRMIRSPAKYVAVGNPRGAMSKIYRQPDQVIQPWWFGDPFRKATCLWLRNLPELVPDYKSEPDLLATATSGDMAGYRLHRAATGGGSWKSDKAAAEAAGLDFNGASHYEDSEGRKNRARVRSRTFPGVARAMADQWGGFIENV